MMVLVRCVLNIPVLKENTHVDLINAQTEKFLEKMALVDNVVDLPEYQMMVRNASRIPAMTDKFSLMMVLANIVQLMKNHVLLSSYVTLMTAMTIHLSNLMVSARNVLHIQDSTKRQTAFLINV